MPGAVVIGIAPEDVENLTSAQQQCDRTGAVSRFRSQVQLIRV